MSKKIRTEAVDYLFEAILSLKNICPAEEQVRFQYL